MGRLQHVLRDAAQADRAAGVRPILQHHIADILAAASKQHRLGLALNARKVRNLVATDRALSFEIAIAARGRACASIDLTATPGARYGFAQQLWQRRGAIQKLLRLTYYICRKGNPAVPPATRSNKGPGEAADAHALNMGDNASESRRRNLEKQGR